MPNNMQVIIYHLILVLSLFGMPEFTKNEKARGGTIKNSEYIYGVMWFSILASPTKKLSVLDIAKNTSTAVMP